MMKRCGRRRRGSVLALLFVAWACGRGEKYVPVTKLTPSPEALLRQSDHIARVRLESREPVPYGFAGEIKNCGYHYEAFVVESIKGEGQQIDFIAWDPVATEQEYLVAVNELSESDRHKISEVATAEQREILICRNRYARVALGLARIEAEADGRETWVLVKDARIVPHEVVDKAIAERVRWVDARAAIVRALSERLDTELSVPE